MRIKSFEFNMRELAGSLGDMGTLLPLTIGYIAVCGMNPAGLLLTVGLANIVCGLVYRLPLPVEPMKVLAVMAIAQAWSPEKVYAGAFATGLIWLLMAATGAMSWVARWTPKSVVRGIQLSLGALLAVQGFKLVSEGWLYRGGAINFGWLLGLAAVAIVLTLRKNRYAPASVVLVLLGLALMWINGQWTSIGGLSLAWPQWTTFQGSQLWPAMRDGGLAQIPLTATNAVIATSILISEYWPERRVSERQLSFNMGVMNVIVPFMGGMPLCHGAGGLAGQYYFGARTGGANLIEGAFELCLGLFLAGGIMAVFLDFPRPIIGVMLLLVGVELVKFARDLKLNHELLPVLVTVGASVALNMAIGFCAGLATHYLIALSVRQTKGKDQAVEGNEHDA